MTESELKLGCVMVLLAFWVAPLAVYFAADRLANVWREAYRSRGLEKGVFYCKHCRFDLRATAGMACPECGARLVGENLIDTAGFRRWPITTHFAFVVLLITPPIFVFVLWLLMILPVNTGDVLYRGDLRSSPDEKVFTVRFNARVARKSDRTSQMDCYYSSSGRDYGSLNAMYNVNRIRENGSAEQLTPESFEKLWGTLGVPTDAGLDPEAVRDQIEWVWDGAANDNLAGADRSGPLSMSFTRDERFMPHWAAVLAALVLGGVVWGVGYRCFARKRQAAIDRYRKYLTERGLRYQRQYGSAESE